VERNGQCDDWGVSMVDTGIESAADGSSIERRPRMVSAKWLLVLLLLLQPAAGLFAWFIWPTGYRYGHMNVRGNIFPVRIERWSGRAEVMYPSGWKAVDGEEKATSNVRALPFGEVARLETTGEWSYGHVRISVYNGSTFHVTQVTVELVVWEKANEREVLRRRYAVDSSYSGPSVKPLSSSQFSFDPHSSIGADHAWSYRLVAARGYPDE
jgi:hypothetical protein